MALPTPNLDDRTWQDIVEEAKKMIPALCPHWTDFNPSDPGITLVELMAWMTEMIIYRLNRVPEKNFIKFMEMIGITLLPPKPASAWLVFDVVGGGENVDLPMIPPHTRVSGVNETGETVVFETVEALNLNAARLQKIYARMRESYSDITDDLISNRPLHQQNIFHSGSRLIHELYLGDPGYAKVGHEFSLRIYIGLEQPGVGLKVRWSAWDGERWAEILPEGERDVINMAKSGDILFKQLPQLHEREVNGQTSLWLRLRLEDYEGSQLPRIKQLQKTLDLKRTSGIYPQRGYVSTEELLLSPIQFQATIRPFGRDAKENDTLYLGSEVFSRHGAPVTMDIRLTESYKAHSIAILKDLEVRWEYYAQNGEWELLGNTTPTGVTKSRWGFVDRTEAFTHSGKAAFYVPGDISPMDLFGETGYWVRVRIHKGNYGLGKKKNPPVCQSFLIFYKEKPANLERYISFNGFSFRNCTSEVLENGVFEPFRVAAGGQPELYMGFNMPFSNELHRLFFLLHQKGGVNSTVVWEYPSESGWQPLNLLRDDTRDFTYPGAVEFIGPDDWRRSENFGQWAHWLRVRWTQYTLDSLPMLTCIHLNVAAAVNAVSHRNLILGTSNGEPFQVFLFNNAPILPHPRILVKEMESTIPQEIEDFKKRVKEEVVEERDTATGEVKALWVVWEEKLNFFFSKRTSRHYILDIYNGRVTFGDGIKGAVPAVGAVIKSEIYYTGGGGRGNVSRNVITNLETAYPFINRVSNPYPASGGADMETIEAAKMRAPWELKHRNRAVTVKDFETLAFNASAEVARAVCLTRKEGIVKIILVPFGKEAKLVPSEALKAKVREYLDERRLITTKIEIDGPEYEEFFIRAQVAPLLHMSDQIPEIKSRIKESLQAFFHPLTGELYKKGWTMGRAVHTSEIYFVIENVSGVDYVRSLDLVIKEKNETTGEVYDKTVEKIDLPDKGLPYLKEVIISFK